MSFTPVDSGRIEDVVAEQHQYTGKFHPDETTFRSEVEDVHPQRRSTMVEPEQSMSKMALRDESEKQFVRMGDDQVHGKSPAKQTSSQEAGHIPMEGRHLSMDSAGETLVRRRTGGE